eukprot:jgi/Mesen1/2117/ME001515S01331
MSNVDSGNRQLLSSQSDIDEIEGLFNVSVQPVPEITSAGPTPKKVAPSKGPSQSAPLLPSVSSSLAPISGSSLRDGNTSGFGGGSTHGTLTEPVWDTLKRDVVRVGTNLRQVVFPNPYREDMGRALRDWDLWGPFFFIIFLSLVLSSSASHNKGKVFATVFGTLSSGAIILTLNVLLLGGKIIFFQSLSVLGYCLFPLDVGAIACLFIDSRLLRGIVVLVTLAWSSWSAYPFVSGAVPHTRRALAVYPVLLLYLAVGFLVLAND